jgi:radical SAM superfamily enzyme YgiQ (UPF0313 family)
VAFLLEGAFANLGVCSLVAVLEQQGHHCDLFIASEERDFWGAVEAFDPDVTGFSFMTGGHGWAVETAAEVRRRRPQTHILFGGVHPTLFPEIIERAEVNAICRGEGEEAVPEYLELLADGKDPSGVANFWVKTPSGIRRNPLRPLIQDLDALPLPNRTIYRKYPYARTWDHYFMAGRGCPYTCSFCANHQFMKLYAGNGHFIRKRSPESVIAEIARAVEEQGIKEAIFFDETFNLSKAWVHRFLTLYREQIPVPLVCSIGVETTDADQIRLLAEAGCKMVIFGVESGNQRIRHQVLRKPFRDRDLRHLAHCLRAAKIPFMTTNILGIPGETIEEAWETVDLNARLRPTVAVASFLIPYPRTDIHDYAVGLGAVDPVDPDDLSPNLYVGSPLRLPNKRQITNIQRFFTLMVKFPELRRWLRPLVQLPPNPLFELLFFIGFAYYQKAFWQRNIFGIIAYGLRNIGLFLRQNRLFSGRRRD